MCKQASQLAHIALPGTWMTQEMADRLAHADFALALEYALPILPFRRSPILRHAILFDDREAFAITEQHAPTHSRKNMG